MSGNEPEPKGASEKSESGVTSEGPTGGLTAVNVPAKVATTMYLGTLAYRIVMALVIGGVVLAITRYGAVPLAKVIVGKNTNFNVSLTLSFSLIINVALAGGVVASEKGRRAALHKYRDLKGERSG